MLKKCKNYLVESLINYLATVRPYGVGITTLEEVFLKIGHGEEME